MPPCSTPYLVIKHRHAMGSHPAGPGLGATAGSTGEGHQHALGHLEQRSRDPGAMDSMVPDGWYPAGGTGRMSVVSGKRLPRSSMIMAEHRSCMKVPTWPHAGPKRILVLGHLEQLEELKGVV